MLLRVVVFTSSDCGDVIELDSSRTEATFSSPDGVDLQCYWLIKVRFILLVYTFIGRLVWCSIFNIIKRL